MKRVCQKLKKLFEFEFFGTWKVFSCPVSIFVGWWNKFSGGFILLEVSQRVFQLWEVHKTKLEVLWHCEKIGGFLNLQESRVFSFSDLKNPALGNQFDQRYCHKMWCGCCFLATWKSKTSCLGYYDQILFFLGSEYCNSGQFGKTSLFRCQ